MQEEQVVIRVVPYGSALHKASVELRDEILRKPLNMSFTEAYLAAEVDHIHVVAVLGSEVVGVIVLQHLENQVIKMRQVAIKQHLQKKGIGRKLVLACEQIAQSQKVTEITMHAREGAVPFYKKLGYHIASDPFMEIGIVHYVMEKVI